MFRYTEVENMLFPFSLIYLLKEVFILSIVNRFINTLPTILS